MHKITTEMVERLTRLGVICREFHLPDDKDLNNSLAKVPFYDPLTRKTFYVEKLGRIFLETLVNVGGLGLKTAVECVLAACECDEVAAGSAVIGTPGSGWGLDTAIVMRATTPERCFSEKLSDRLEIREILAMPIRKQRWG